MEEEAQDRREEIIITETTVSSFAEATMYPPETPPRNLDEVEEILGYNFKNKCLLEEAFTFPSYYYNTKDDNRNNEAETKCFSFERLEFFGDAVLNFLVTKEQFFSCPDFSSGLLTQLRAANVDTEKLARVAVKLELYSYLRHRNPLLEEKIIEFMKEILEYPIQSSGLIDVPKCLANLVESIIGAIFIDCHCNIDIVWQVFKPLLEPMVNEETLKTHPVTELHQVLQKHNLKPQYVDSWEDSMEVQVLVDDQLVGKGICSSKKEIAKNRAALNALQNIQTILSAKDNSTSNDNTED